jgi:hypothetical protein
MVVLPISRSARCASVQAVDASAWCADVVDLPTGTWRWRLAGERNECRVDTHLRTVGLGEFYAPSEVFVTSWLMEVAGVVALHRMRASFAVRVGCKGGCCATAARRRALRDCHDGRVLACLVLGQLRVRVHMGAAWGHGAKDQLWEGAYRANGQLWC